jgi:transposase
MGKKKIVDEKAIVRRYRETQSAKVVSEEFGVGETLILKIVRLYGVFVTRSGRPRMNVFDEDAAVRRYRELGNSRKVADEFGTGSDVIIRLLRSRGIAVGKPGACAKFSEEQLKEIVVLYKGGLSQRLIAEKFGVTQQGIAKMIGRVRGGS